MSGNSFKVVLLVDVDVTFADHVRMIRFGRPRLRFYAASLNLAASRTKTRVMMTSLSAERAAEQAFSKADSTAALATEKAKAAIEGDALAKAAAAKAAALPKQLPPRLPRPLHV